jgi:hypothetical protein
VPGDCSSVGQYNYATFLVSGSKDPSNCIRALFWFDRAAMGGSQYAADYSEPLRRGVDQGRFAGGCVEVIGETGGDE